MDVLMDPTFWGEVGLAAAAKLALLAAVVWVARMAVNRTRPASPPAPRNVEYTPSAVTRHRIEPAAAPAATEPSFVNLKPRPVTAVAGTQHNVTHDRLMQYVQRRAMERIPS
ncbi:MAG: hypothetical protein HZB43_05000 [candidate division Zixibacteria bacterium]|nr:hypothetical protein [candidate division Zixibacteria bacterium]